MSNNIIQLNQELIHDELKDLVKYSVEEALIKMYLAGVSVHRVEDITEALWGIEETLTYMNFPTEHWRKIRTNNAMERVNRAIKRRTKAIGAFPDGASALMLVCARLRYVANSRWRCKNYMNMDHLNEIADESYEYID